MGEQRIVFNSSFPRSGSTLLQNILAQNPRFYCSPTSGLINLLLAARHQFTNAAMFKAQERNLTRPAFAGFCQGGMEGFYKGLTDKPVCVDKNRTWFHYSDWLNSFHPSPKILICIRDLRAVLSSMEKLFRKNRDLEDPADVTDTLSMVSITNRITQWLNGNPVGVAALRLLEAVETGRIKQFKVIRFEDLTAKPEEALREVYEYLEEPFFEHDFNNVEQRTQENDANFVFYGDHRIRRKVEPVRPDYNEVLGKDLATMVKANNPVFYDTFYPRLH